MKVDAISDVKHDINSGLVLILEANELIRAHSNGKHADFNQSILTSVIKLQNSINRLMELNKIKGGISVDFEQYQGDGNENT